MARHVKVIPIVNDDDPDNRDNGKKFRITEMSSAKTAFWGMRAAQSILRTGILDGREDVQDALSFLMDIGIVNVFRMLDVTDAWSLMEEMIGTIRIMPNLKQPDYDRELIEDDIEEPSTRLFLFMEAVKLHFNFFTNADRTTSTQASTETAESTPNIPTSQSPSEPQFHPSRRR